MTDRIGITTTVAQVLAELQEAGWLLRPRVAGGRKLAGGTAFVPVPGW